MNHTVFGLDREVLRLMLDAKKDDVTGLTIVYDLDGEILLYSFAQAIFPWLSSVPMDILNFISCKPVGDHYKPRAIEAKPAPTLMLVSNP